MPPTQNYSGVNTFQYAREWDGWQTGQSKGLEQNKQIFQLNKNFLNVTKHFKIYHFNHIMTIIY